MAASSPPKPLAPRRHDEIMRRLAADGSVSIAELARFFGVSRETIRRDMKSLAKRGQLGLVHGGATLFEATEPDLTLRTRENAAGKAAIARAAASLVRDGMVVFLDCGTTTLAIAQALGGFQRLTICTTSLPIALHLCRQPQMRVHILGGEIDPSLEAATGIDAIEAITRFRVDIAFVGAGGLSPEGEVTDFTREGAEQRSRVAAAAAQTYFVLDSSKFGRLTPLRIPRFESAAAIISDAAPPAPMREALERRGLKLIVASNAAASAGDGPEPNGREPV
jgi:DeoR/GlpR family transcriptional regulator of sugar metabolism